MTSRAAPKHAPGAPRMPFALLVVGLFVGGMCALLALNTASAANEVGRHRIGAQDQSVAALLVELQDEARASAAPANLAAAAAALGMVPAGNPAFLQIGPNGKVRVLGSAAAASAAPIVVQRSTATTSKPAVASHSKPTGRTSGTRQPGHPNQRAKKRAGTPAESGKRTSSSSSTASPTTTPTPNSTLPGGTR